ncbi:hypothetical protein MHBO_001996, partial [Bonamia ostreae]
MPIKYNRYLDINPNDTLQRANEFIKLNENISAFETIDNFLNQRKISRATFVDGFETMIESYLGLCFDLRFSPKDGLRRYRIVCFQSSTPNIYLRRVYESLLTRLSNFGIEAVRNLKIKFKSNFVSKQYYSEKLSFQWDCYLSVLDNIKFIPDLITLYSETTEEAIDFCRVLRRPHELQKLHGTINAHFLSFLRYQGKKDSIDIGDQKTLKIFISLRFKILSAFSECGEFRE